MAEPRTAAGASAGFKALTAFRSELCKQKAAATLVAEAPKRRRRERRTQSSDRLQVRALQTKRAFARTEHYLNKLRIHETLRLCKKVPPTRNGRGDHPVEIDIAHLKTWIGKTEARTDLLAPFPANALAATLDRDDPEFTDGIDLPPMWHLVYCLPASKISKLGYDGHAAKGGFLPPVPLPRRMWAGGRFTFNHALKIGSKVTRTARVLDVSHKAGRTGSLVFVTARFEMSDERGIALSEERDIVYREPQTGGAPQNAAQTAPKQAPANPAWERVIHPDPVLLFRYSALTFNGHRIHYDQPFATKQEGYPGLIVHGPLLATLLVDLVRRKCPDAAVKTFAFRAVSPLFDTNDFAICGTPSPDGKTIQLWARGHDGALAMEATATLA